jgi:hypothetical protein
VAVDRGVPVQADALNEIRAMTIRRELAPPCTSMSVRPPGWCSKPDVSLMPQIAPALADVRIDRRLASLWPKTF